MRARAGQNWACALCECGGRFVKRPYMWYVNQIYIVENPRAGTETCPCGIVHQVYLAERLPFERICKKSAQRKPTICPRQREGNWVAHQICFADNLRAVGYFKANVGKKIHKAEPNFGVWQRGFYVRIIRNPAEFENAWSYRKCCRKGMCKSGKVHPPANP